ncbi:4-diphosphocytidyl-2-C-methyl-D-erythritol kinase [Clostridia bacterium]|nr:4-diphosphocytidyl-2-C-methyl-D-erythritol kinase [Clostridia bacterium]
MLSSVVVQAPAKINLGLDILGSTDDDYHLLRTIMQTVDIYDVIEIEKNNLGQINLTCDPAVTPTIDQNLSYRAAQLFFKETEIDDYGIDICVKKSIPVAAGLAGGSADAAGVLVGLNRLYETNLSLDELCGMALKLGADIPFCVCGGIQLADGVGEIFTPLPNLPECYFVIAKPDELVSTKEAFERYDRTEITNRPDIDGVIAGVVAQNLDVVVSHMQNVFEEVVCVNSVKKIKDLMLEFGALGSSMTGSGPAVFGIFENKLKAKRCFKALKEKDFVDVFLTVPVDCGAVVIEEL